MIKPAIKLGPKDWLPRLQKSHAQYVEIWYRIDQPQWYQEHFSYLRQHRINTGLHYWGAIDDTWETNIGYPGPTFEKSLALIKRCIDDAKNNSCAYVNIHSGNLGLVRLDLATQSFAPDTTSPLVSLEEATNIQRESLIELNDYANKAGVLLLVETVPAKLSSSTWNDPQGRLHPKSQYPIPTSCLIKRAQEDNILITNDFCHTFAQMFDQPRQTLKNAFLDMTLALVPFTKLIHVNTVEPPFNGTDSHHGILENDFAITDIFPNYNELIELLKLFKDRDDVWALVEPSDKHVENFLSLQKLLQTL